MQSPRFMVLTGHLDDYPLSDLIGILRHQRKTGRLQIEYPHHPAAFFFKDGELVDAQLSNMKGLQAVCVAVSQPNAPFNFNPLIQPPAQALDTWAQKIVLEMFGCWNDEPLENAAAPSEPGEAATQFQPTPSVNLPPPFQLKASPPPEAAVAVVEPQISPTTTVKANRPEPPVKAPASSSPLFASAQRQAAGPHRRLVSITAGAVCLVLLSLSVVLAITQRTRFKGAAQPPEHSLSAPETFVGPTQPAAQPAEPPATTPDDESAAIASPEVRAASNKSPGRNREAAKETTDPSSATTSPQPESAAAAAPAKPAMTRPTERAEASKKTAALKKAETPKKKEAADGGGDGEAVRVLMQIENGRVVGASVVNSRPGMQAYEAMALRLARGRRYAATSGQETITIKINPSQPR